MKHVPASRFAHATVLCLALAAAWPAAAQTSTSSTVDGSTGTSSSSTATSAYGTDASTTSGSSNYGSAYGSPYGSDGFSILPYTRRGYVGLNVGSAEWEHGCAPGFGCDDPDATVYLYTGGLINDMFGLELGYLNVGSADRDGGRVRAHGLNLSLVARAPIGAFNAFAKLGALYGETRVSASPLSGVGTGKERGWGASYGLGVGYDFSPQTGLVLEWTRHELRFPTGGTRRDLDSVSLGLVHRF